MLDELIKKYKEYYSYMSECYPETEDWDNFSDFMEWLTNPEPADIVNLS